MTIKLWTNLPFFKNDYFKLQAKLNANPNFLPGADYMYNAIYNPSGPAHTKVVILGQDPYPTPGHAHGYAFSVNKHIKALPKSLQNIFKEMVDDLGCDYPKHGNLEGWATQGVMLLNTSLTVSPFQPGSHCKWGWEQLTREIICTLVEQTKHKVFILWGKHAQAYAPFIDSNHLILTAPHPSPLAAHLGFFGSKPFSQTNAYLKEHGIAPINWGTYGQGNPAAFKTSPRPRQ